MSATLNDYEAVLKALADPVRARIIKLLEGRELYVSDLIAVLGLSQSTVSGHLQVLRRAGLISGRRQGRRIFYSLSDRMRNRFAPAMLALLMGWLDDDARVRADKRRLAARVPGRES